MTEAGEDDKAMLILLAGLLLKEEPRPDVRKLERLIKVKDGTLSELFPQHKKRTSSGTKIEKGGEDSDK
jgi:hypothetical protein